MRICIYGAGASGGHLALRLARAGHEVGVLARGTQLAALGAQGVTMLSGEAVLTAKVRASDDPAALGPQELVLVTVKATGLAAVAAGLAPLVDGATQVLFLQNGMAWWYPHGLPPDRPAPPDLPIFALGARFLDVLWPAQVLGGSLYSANVLEAPGVVRNTSPDRNGIALAPIVATAEPEAAAMRAVLAGAGLDCPPVDDVRCMVWSKLLVNMSGSAIALATENRSSVCRTDPALADIYSRAVREGLEIARAHGYPLDAIVDPERLLDGLHDHKPSLLQDYEAGRRMELAEIIAAPMAFARAAGLATPTLDTLAAIVLRRARDRGLL